jgi:endonuclease-3 related protein
MKSKGQESKIPAKPSPMKIYSLLERRFGFRDWWPGDSKEEIVIGAILTQQASWKNVEKAIAALKENGYIDIDKLATCRIAFLEKMIRSSGFYRQKAKRLKGFCAFVKTRYGSLENLFRMPLGQLRGVLLSVNGIGPETADSIILYAAEKPVFVIDAYTRRSMARIHLLNEEPDYESLQKYFETITPKKTALYNDMHAQFVELGKNYCKTKPLCDSCPLIEICLMGQIVENK